MNCPKGMTFLGVSFGPKTGIDLNHFSLTSAKGYRFYRRVPENGYELYGPRLKTGIEK